MSAVFATRTHLENCILSWYKGVQYFNCFVHGRAQVIISFDLLLFVVELGKKFSPKDPGPLDYLKNWFV